VIGFEFRASCFLERHSIMSATFPALFFISHFSVRVLCVLVQDWYWVAIFLPMASQVARIITTQCTGWDGTSPTFFSSWPRTMILLISAYTVSGITGVSHCAWPLIEYFNNRTYELPWEFLWNVSAGNAPSEFLV
jgi:hypothetical protein